MKQETIIEKLTAADLRPTRQRVIIGERLWAADGDRHVTAEQLFNECKEAGAPVSMATVYNTLHQFVDAGLLKEVVVDSGCCYFDTNVDEHHHFYFEDTGRLEDVAADQVAIASLPTPDGGKSNIRAIEVIIRVANDPMPACA